MQTNLPVLVEVTRGDIVESRHHGSFAIVGKNGALLHAAGDIQGPVYPRSAIKAFQALPLLESGAADQFGFSDEELALAISSHNGEPEHVRVAKSMLEKAGVNEADYECGSHWPYDHKALRALIAEGGAPRDIHNNCSGKHAGMLAAAKALSAPTKAYSTIDHPLQQAIAKAMGEMCEIDLHKATWAIDGCSVPTWAIPLQNLARGFQKFASGEGLSEARKNACQRLINAAKNHPFMVAGSDRFCTNLMQALPRAFLKDGAEGMFCASIPHAGLGVAIKCEDGAHRAAEIACAGVLSLLDVWNEAERKVLENFMREPIKSRKGVIVGEVRSVIANNPALH